MIPRKILDEFTDKLELLSDAARKVALKQIQAIEWETVAELRQKLIEILDPLLAAATDDAATFAGQFYEDIRYESIKKPYDAMYDSFRDPEKTEEAIRAILQKLVDSGQFDAILGPLLDRVDYEIKKAAGDNVINNSLQDPSSRKYARVPADGEACGFCLMLASQGFVYLSKKSAGNDEGHYHPNCRCRIVPGFADTEIEGYDPNKIYDEWSKTAHADYMYNRRNRTSRNNGSMYSHAKTDKTPAFKDFNDVKSYIYDAKDTQDLENRWLNLARVYGFNSKQITSTSLKNVVKTTNKRLAKS